MGRGAVRGAVPGTAMACSRDPATPGAVDRTLMIHRWGSREGPTRAWRRGDPTLPSTTSLEQPLFVFPGAELLGYPLRPLLFSNLCHNYATPTLEFRLGLP